MSKTTIDVMEAGGKIASEASIADGQKRFKILIIEGDVQGSSGFYPADVIERDGPKAFPKGMHMHLDHQSMEKFWNYPAGSIKDWVGIIDSTPVYEDNALFAEAMVFSKWAPLIEELAPYIGVSIRALATRDAPDADGVERVNAIERGITVDFVTLAGAGGKVVEVLESHKEVLPEGFNLITNIPTKPVVESTKSKGKPMADLTEETGQQILADLKEARLAREAAAAAATAPKPVDIAAVIAGAVTALAESGLPAPTVRRITASIARDPEIKLDEAIAEAKAEIAEAVKAAGVQSAATAGRVAFSLPTMTVTEQSAAQAPAGQTNIAESVTKLLSAWGGKAL